MHSDDGGLDSLLLEDDEDSTVSKLPDDTQQQAVEKPGMTQDAQAINGEYQMQINQRFLKYCVCL